MFFICASRYVRFATAIIRSVNRIQSGSVIGAPFIFLCGDTRDKATLVIAMTLFGLAKGLYDGNIWASLFDVVPAARRAAAVGLMNMYGWLGGGLGAYAVQYAKLLSVTASSRVRAVLTASVPRASARCSHWPPPAP